MFRKHAGCCTACRGNGCRWSDLPSGRHPLRIQTNFMSGSACKSHPPGIERRLISHNLILYIVFIITLRKISAEADFMMIWQNNCFNVIFVIRLNICSVPLVTQWLDISCKTIQIFIGAAFILPDHGHQATSHSQQLLICTGSLGCFRRSSCLYDPNTDSLMDTPVLQRSYSVPLKGAVASYPSSSLSLWAKISVTVSSPCVTNTCFGLVSKAFAHSISPFTSAWPLIPGIAYFSSYLHSLTKQLHLHSTFQ